MATISVTSQPAAPAEGSEAVLPFVRLPILDRDDQLVGYELRFQGEGDAELTRSTVEIFVHSGLQQLIGGSRAFAPFNRELLIEHAQLLRLGSRLGIQVDTALALQDDAAEALAGIAGRSAGLMLDDFDWPANASEERAARLGMLVRGAQYAAIDVRRHDEAALFDLVSRLRSAGVKVVAKHIDGHDRHRQCVDLGFDAFEGQYLFKPAPVTSDTLRPNRLNVLRLLAAVQDPENGPIELEALIRNDAVLSYKLLSCVNSAYFNLPRELKTLQQAAIFFGVARIRNWVYAMSLSAMDDNSPELLKQALLRARMCELLARNLRGDLREMAFTMGLFSLLDTLMGVSMAQVLEHVPVAEAVRQALVNREGPLAQVLEQVHAWESGYVVHARTASGGTVNLAEAYLRAAEWADHVYSFADAKAA